MSIVEAEDRTALPLSIRVRLAGPRDCAALATLLDDPSQAREHLLTWLETPGTTLLVAQSEIGGMHKVVEVDNLVVHPEQRGQRIGRRLLAAVVEWARQRRAAQVEVMVGDTNRDARRFYEAFGFATSADRLVLAA